MPDSYQVRYFLGANSPQGFYSLYPELIPPETARAVYAGERVSHWWAVLRPGEEEP